MLHESVSMTYPEQGNTQNRKQISGCQELGQGRKRGLFKGYGVSLGDDKCFGTDRGDAANIVNVLSAFA